MKTEIYNKLEQLQELLIQAQQLANEIQVSEAAREEEHKAEYWKAMKCNDNEAYEFHYEAYDDARNNNFVLQTTSIQIGYEIERISNLI